MIKPSNIANKRVSISGSGIAEVDVNFDGEKINLLIGSGLLLRFQFKETKHSKFFKVVQQKILRDREFLSSKKQQNLDAMVLSDREIREMINKDKKELIRREESDFKDFLDSVRKRQKQLEKFSKVLGITVTKEHAEYYCNTCRGFRAGPDLTEKSPQHCKYCDNILKKKNISGIENEIASYLGGYWLEDYVANILNSNGWVAWSLPSLNVYGVSGAPHQVDVLAIKNGRILIVECKTGDFTPSQIRTFLGKYYDIRCHQALAISLENIHPDGIKLIEKNLAITSCDKITSHTRLSAKISKI